jgi:3-deoxy-D-manno-octulosonic-acid transferase
VLLAASTRDGEEALLLDALPELASDALLVIVPRHPQRFDEVAALLESRGITYGRRSTGFEVDTATRVVLGDSMGELTAYYAASDVAYIGGSLLPFGGQNLIEACAVGVPVLVGPHTYNFAEAAEKAVAAGAALRAGDAVELARTASKLLAEPDTLSRMSARALEFSRAHQGATEQVMKLLAISAATGSPQRGRLR